MGASRQSEAADQRRRRTSSSGQRGGESARSSRHAVPIQNLPCHGAVCLMQATLITFYLRIFHVALLECTAKHEEAAHSTKRTRSQLVLRCPTLSLFGLHSAVVCIREGSVCTMAVLLEVWMLGSRSSVAALVGFTRSPVCLCLGFHLGDRLIDRPPPASTGHAPRQLETVSSLLAPAARFRRPSEPTGQPLMR